MKYSDELKIQLLEEIKAGRNSISLGRSPVPLIELCFEADHQGIIRFEGWNMFITEKGNKILESKMSETK